MKTMYYNEISEQLKNCSFDDWHKLAQDRSIKMFHEAAERVPAYKDFLSKNKIDHSKVVTEQDFRNVPVTDKNNYILQYELNDMCWDGDITRGGIIATSSGTTGNPLFWPRFVENDRETKLLHEVMFKNLYGAYEHPTLFVVCFHLGAHIAGVITANAIKDLIDSGMPGSLVTTGLNQRDILNTVKKLSGSFKQTVLIGYPPFIKDVIVEGEKEGLDWKGINVKFMFSAESFPETWRAKLYYQVGIKNIEDGGVNVYGSADMGFMGHETGLTIRLRRLLADNDIEKDKLGIANLHLPGIYQYHAWNKYFEHVHDELVCTSNSGIPLIRYDLRDIGRVIKPEKVAEIFRDKNVFREGDWRLPILMVFGRSNYTTTLYGVNILPENIREILFRDELIGKFNSRFFISTIHGDDGQYLEIHVEKSFNESTDKINDNADYGEIFGKYLATVNMEYKKLREAVGDKAKPVVIVYENGAKQFSDLKVKHKYIIDKSAK